MGASSSRRARSKFAEISVQAQTGAQTLRATFPNAGHMLLPVSS